MYQPTLLRRTPHSKGSAIYPLPHTVHQLTDAHDCVGVAYSLTTPVSLAHLDSAMDDRDIIRTRPRLSGR